MVCVIIPTRPQTCGSCIYMNGVCLYFPVGSGAAVGGGSATRCV